MSKRVKLDNSIFKEVKTTENVDNYTGENDDEKTYLLESNEYVIVNDDSEVFAPLLEDESIIVSIKDNDKLVVSGDINALNGFAFLYDKGYLDGAQIYILFNNDFDYEKFTKLTNEIDSGIMALVDDFSDNEDDVSINVTSDEIKVSKGYGDIYSYEIQKENVKSR